jgi:hypothetical protein
MIFSIHWHPHVGDPTAIGWTITIAYFVVAFLCYRAGLSAKPADSSIDKICKEIPIL